MSEKTKELHRVTQKAVKAALMFAVLHACAVKTVFGGSAAQRHLFASK